MLSALELSSDESSSVVFSVLFVGKITGFRGTSMSSMFVDDNLTCLGRDPFVFLFASQVNRKMSSSERPWGISSSFVSGLLSESLSSIVSIRVKIITEGSLEGSLINSVLKV